MARAGKRSEPDAHTLRAATTESVVTGDRILLAAARHSGVRAAALCGTATLAAAAALLLPAALGRALDRLLTAGGAGAGPWIAACAVLSGVLVLLDAVDAVLTGTLNARSTAWLRTRLLGHVLALGPGRGARFGDGDLVTRATGNAALAGSAPPLPRPCSPRSPCPSAAWWPSRCSTSGSAAVFLAGTPLLALLLRAFTRSSSDWVTRYQEAQATLAGASWRPWAGPGRSLPRAPCGTRGSACWSRWTS